LNINKFTLPNLFDTVLEILFNNLVKFLQLLGSFVRNVALNLAYSQ
jgi:hypothetical protein